MSRSSISLVIPLCLLGVTEVAAQNSTASTGSNPKDWVRQICIDTQEEIEMEACENWYSAALDVGDTQGATLDDGSAAVVGINDKTGTASIQFTRPWQRGKLSATVTAALDEETGTAEFIGFGDGISADKVKVEYNYIHWPDYPLFNLTLGQEPGSFYGAKELDIQTVFEASACVAFARSLKENQLSAQQQGQFSSQLDSINKKLADADLPTQEQIESYLRRVPTGGSAGGAKSAEDSLADKKVQGIINQFEEDDTLCSLLSPLFPEKELIAKLKLSSQDFPNIAHIYGANATVGRKEFSFLDRDLLLSDGKLDTISDREMPTSFGGRYGVLFLTQELEPEAYASLILSYNSEKGYKTADDLTFCQPVEGLEEASSLESCKEIAGSAPSSTGSDLVSLEYRQRLEKVGLAIRGFYRANHDQADDFGIEVPIYFLTNKDGGFQGGVSFGWRDQDDDISIAVFVGRKFELF